MHHHFRVQACKDVSPSWGGEIFGDQDPNYVAVSDTHQRYVLSPSSSTYLTTKSDWETSGIIIIAIYIYICHAINAFSSKAIPVTETSQQQLWRFGFEKEKSS